MMNKEEELLKLLTDKKAIEDKIKLIKGVVVYCIYCTHNCECRCGWANFESMYCPVPFGGRCYVNDSLIGNAEPRIITPLEEE